jgi:hypothetical protein
MRWATFWAIFSQTHLVTLLASNAPPQSGWPDLASFRLFGNCLLFLKVFLKTVEKAQSYGYFFPLGKLCIKFDKRVGLHFGSFSFTNSPGHPVHIGKFFSWQTSQGIN